MKLEKPYERCTAEAGGHLKSFASIDLRLSYVTHRQLFVPVHKGE